MTKRNVRFLFFLLVAALDAGYLVDWWLVAGLLVGAAVAVYIYQRRYSVVDELESEVHWYAQRGWQDSPEGEDSPQWGEVWRPVLVILFVVALVVATVIGLMM